MVVFKPLDNDNNNPTVTYQLGKTIRNKILNYKETVSSINVDKNVPFCLNTDQCNQHCPFSFFKIIFRKPA